MPVGAGRGHLPSGARPLTSQCSPEGSVALASQTATPRGCYTRGVQLHLRRRLAVLVTVTAVGVGALVLHRFWMRALLHLTGDAEWIWVTNSLERVFPAAGLFVASLDLDEAPVDAVLKVSGDREYVVYVNGSAAACGWSRPGFRLDLYDVTHLLHPGQNVIAAEVRSPTPAGGLLVALDVGSHGTNTLVSGPAFRLRRLFSLAPEQPNDGAPPVRWGLPPRFPWGYPAVVPRPRTLDQVVVEDPMRTERADAQVLPGGGIAFAFPERHFGYLWLEFDGDGACYVTTLDGTAPPDSAPLRRAAQPVVRVAAQRRWLDPEPRWITRVYAFGRCLPVAAELHPVPDEFRSAAPGVVPGKFGPVPRTRWTTRTPPE